MLILPDLEMKKIQEFRGMERNYNLLPFLEGGGAGIKLSPTRYRLWEYSSEQNKINPSTQNLFSNTKPYHTWWGFSILRQGNVRSQHNMLPQQWSRLTCSKGQQTCNLVTQLCKSLRGAGWGVSFLFDALNRSRIPEILPLGNGERRKGRWRTEEIKIKIPPTILHFFPQRVIHSWAIWCQSWRERRCLLRRLAPLSSGCNSRGKVLGTNLRLWAVTGVNPSVSFCLNPCQSTPLVSSFQTNTAVIMSDCNSLGLG